MGAECVCSPVENNSPPEILNSISRHHAVMTNSRRPCKLEAKDNDDFEKEAFEEGTDCSYNFGQNSNEMDNSGVFESFEEDFIKNESERRSKKRIHLMLPKGESEENEDNVIFLSGQITNSHLNFISSALEDHCIFSQLTDIERRYMICKMRYCKSVEGSYIFEQGDKSQSFYILIEGQCRVEINGETRKIIEKGDYFGDLGVIYCVARLASIVSEKECLLVELCNKEFRQILEDLSSMSEKENRELLENIDCFQELNELQKNVLASSCVTEFYHSGQKIFSKGDIANSLYVVKEGEVSIADKNIDIKRGENFGMSAIMTSTQTLRTNSIIAKTDCKLLSLTRGVIINNLGTDIGQIIRQNLTLKILKESKIWKMFNPEQWNRALEKMVASSFNKNDLIFGKGTTIEPLKLAIILSTHAICNSEVCYKSNSIIEPSLVLKKKEITFDDDFYSKSEGYCVTLDLTKEKMKNQIYMRSNSGNNVNRASTDSDYIKEGKESLMCLKDFIVLKKLRSGNYGKVYACYNKKTAEKYAIKVINKTFMAACKLMSYVKKEEELILTLPEHPFIVKCHAVFKDENFYMIVMNLLEGVDLFDAMDARLPFPESQCKFFISQLFLIIEHLHNNKIIYRDMKPENVMLNMDGYLTLVDMGTAKRLNIESRFKTNTIIGTPHYMAPEIIVGKGYGFGVDWWSLGVMLYEMASGKLPYGETIENPFLVYREILQVELSFPTIVTASIKEMLSKILVKSPDNRLKNGFYELKNLAFFSNLDWDKLLRKEYSTTIFPHKSCQIDSKTISNKISKKQPCAFQIFLKDKEKTVEKLSEF